MDRHVPENPRGRIIGGARDVPGGGRCLRCAHALEHVMATAKQITALFRSFTDQDDAQFFRVILQRHTQLVRELRELLPKAIAAELGLRLLPLRLETLTTRLLGQTAAKLRLVFAMAECRTPSPSSTPSERVLHMRPRVQ